MNPIRHVQIFQPADFGDKRVDIIGVGALGSKIALEVAKLGVKNIHLWDFDSVEDHNLPNQMYSLSHVGMTKVRACANVIKRDTGTRVTTHNVKIAPGMKIEFGDVVFLQTDSMETRKLIWEEHVRLNFRTHLMVETRMGTFTGRVYTVDPQNPVHVKEYEKTLYTDEKALPSVCGTKTTIGATGDIITGYAVWQFLLWNMELQGKEVTLENEIILCVNPPILTSRKF
jgi:molybdopterin/thiamine biosynthesis adenylyltransferase